MEDQKSARLVILSGKRRGEEVAVPAQGVTVGRTEDADVVIKDKSISRIHARFEFDGSLCSVRDLGSKNGIRVNNRKVDSFTLHSGDLVSLGNVRLKFIDPAETAGPQPEAGSAIPVAPPPAVPAAAPPAPPIRIKPAPASPGPAPFARNDPPAVQRSVLPSAGGSASPSVFSPPPGFLDYEGPVKDDEPKPQATIRTLLPYIVIFLVAGAGLAFLAYQTFREKYVPFKEDVKLAVGEIRLLDLVRHLRIARGAFTQIKSARIADASYNRDNSILRVKGLALGDTDFEFVDEDKNLLGTVQIHVLEPFSKAAEDYSAVPEEELVKKARELVREGDSLGMPKLPDALAKYDEAEKIYNLLPDSAEGKQDAIEKSGKFRDERTRRFESLKASLKEAWRMNNKPQAKACLVKIMEMFPDESDENYQQARIFMNRITDPDSDRKGK